MKIKLKKDKFGKMIPDYVYINPFANVKEKDKTKGPFGIIYSSDPEIPTDNSAKL